MVVTDTIADMLTRIRNANQMKYDTVLVPSTKMTRAISDILKEQGYINGYELQSNKTGEMLVINLKYGNRKERVISGLKRISKPGLRVYVKKDEVPKVLNGLGIAIVSTSQGLMTDKDARSKGLGGEILAYIW